MGRGKISNLLFADDLLLVATSEDELFLLLRVLDSWCVDYGMVVSELKSKVVSTSDLDFWEILTPEFDYVCSIESVKFWRYLGVDVYPSLAAIRKGKSDKISSMAASYAKSILRMSKTVADRVDVVVALWKNVALPALLYGCEVLSLTRSCLDDLEHWQAVVGKSALQVPGSTANELVNLDLGFKPVSMIVWEQKLRYYKRISSPTFSGSSFVTDCLEFHKSIGCRSPYLSEIDLCGCRPSQRA